MFLLQVEQRACNIVILPPSEQQTSEMLHKIHQVHYKEVYKSKYWHKSSFTADNINHPSETPTHPSPWGGGDWST